MADPSPWPPRYSPGCKSSAPYCAPAGRTWSSSHGKGDDRIHNSAARIPATAIARTIPGNEIIMSAIRMITASRTPRNNRPQCQKRSHNHNDSHQRQSCRQRSSVPKITREKRSRPIRSVPNQCRRWTAAPRSPARPLGIVSGDQRREHRRGHQQEQPEQKDGKRGLFLIKIFSVLPYLPSSFFYPGIQPVVGNIHQQVQHHIDQSNPENVCLNQRVIILVTASTADCQAGIGENHLHHSCAAQQRTERKAQHGNQRQNGIGQHVSPENHAFLNAPAPGSVT